MKILNKIYTVLSAFTLVSTMFLGSIISADPVPNQSPEPYVYAWKMVPGNWKFIGGTGQIFGYDGMTIDGNTEGSYRFSAYHWFYLYPDTHDPDGILTHYRWEIEGVGDTGWQLILCDDIPDSDEVFDIIQWPTEGTYMVRLSVRDDDLLECSAYLYMDIEEYINEPPEPYVYAWELIPGDWDFLGGTGQIFGYDGMTIDGNTEGSYRFSAYSYQWFFPDTCDPDGTLTHYRWEIEGVGDTDWQDIPADDIPDSDEVFDIIQWPNPGTYMVRLSVRDDDLLECSAYLYMNILVPPPEFPEAYIYAYEMVNGNWKFLGGTGTLLGGDGMTIYGDTEGSYRFSAYAPYFWLPDTHDPDGTLTHYRWEIEGVGDTGWQLILCDDIPDTDEIFDIIQWPNPGTYMVRLSVRDNEFGEDSAYLYMDIETYIPKNPEAYIYAYEMVDGNWKFLGGTGQIFGYDGMIIEGDTEGSYRFSAYAPYFWLPDTHDPDGTLTHYRWEIEGVGDTDWQQIPPDGIPDTDEIFDIIQWPNPGIYKVKLSVKDNDLEKDSAYLYMDIYPYNPKNPEAYIYAYEMVDSNWKFLGGTGQIFGYDGMIIYGNTAGSYGFSAYAPYFWLPDTHDPDGQLIYYRWEIESVGDTGWQDVPPDGIPDTDEIFDIIQWPNPGTYKVKLSVKDNYLKEDIAYLYMDIEPYIPKNPEAYIYAYEMVDGDWDFLGGTGQIFGYDGMIIEGDNRGSYGFSAYAPYFWLPDTHDPDGQLIYYRWEIESVGDTDWQDVPPDGIPDTDEIFDIIQWPNPGTYKVKLSVIDNNLEEDIAYLYMDIEEYIPIPPEPYVYAYEFINGKWKFLGGTGQIFGYDGMIIEGDTEGSYGFSAYTSYFWLPNTHDPDGILTHYRWEIEGVGGTGWQEILHGCEIPDTDEIFGTIQWTTQGYYKVRLSVRDNDLLECSAYLYMYIEGNEEPEAYIYAWELINCKWKFLGGTGQIFGYDGMIIEGDTEGSYGFSANSYRFWLPDTHDPDGILTHYRWEIEGVGDTGWLQIPPGGIPDTDEIFDIIQWYIPDLYTVRLSVRDDDLEEDSAYLYMDVKVHDPENPEPYVYAYEFINGKWKFLGGTGQIFGYDGMIIEGDTEGSYGFSAYPPYFWLPNTHDPDGQLTHYRWYIEGVGDTGWLQIPPGGIPDTDEIFGTIQWEIPDLYTVRLCVRDDDLLECSAYLYMDIENYINEPPEPYVYAYEFDNGKWDYLGGTFLGGDAMIIVGSTEGSYGFSEDHWFFLFPNTHDPDGQLTRYRWYIEGVGDTGWHDIISAQDDIPDTDEIFGTIQWTTPGIYRVKLFVMDNRGEICSAYLYMDISEDGNGYPNTYIYAWEDSQMEQEFIGDTFFGGNGISLEQTIFNGYVFSAYKPSDHPGQDTNDPNGELTHYRWEIEGIGDTGWQVIPPGGIPDTDEIFGTIQWLNPGKYDVKLYVCDNDHDIRIIDKRPIIDAALMMNIS